MSFRAPLYDPEAVQPMWQELDFCGIRPLTSAEEVDDVLGKSEGTVLLVLNSICGCAAGNARPGVMMSLQSKIIPDNLVTVFAGMDHDAVDRARGSMPQVQPSSPCIALFKDGQPIHVLERRHIENMTAQDIASDLSRVYAATCSAVGPSIPPEEFSKVIPIEQCGSTIARFNQ